MKLDVIYNEDCYKGIKNIPSNSIDLIVTDPPYDMNIGTSNNCGVMKGRTNTFIQQIKETNLDKGLNFEILDEYVRVLKRINIYIWCNKSMIFPLLKYFVEEKKCNYDLLIWGKSNPIPFCGSHYLVDKEYCLFFWEQGATIEIPFERAKTVYVTNTNTSDKEEFGHPTIKPMEIIKNLISNSTKVGGVVLDTFMGSGTTAVACKELDRHYIGFELNPDYYRIAVDRVNGISARDRELKSKGVQTIFDFL